jgi:hypothetical protein
VASYPRLEPNHEVVEEDDLLVVICPFQDQRSTWSRDAAEELDCLFCENLNVIAEKAEGPDWNTHPGEEDADEGSEEEL